MQIHITGGTVIDTAAAVFGPFGIRIPEAQVPDGLEGPAGTDLVVPWAQVTLIHATDDEFTDFGLL